MRRSASARASPQPPGDHRHEHRHRGVDEEGRDAAAGLDRERVVRAQEEEVEEQRAERGHHERERAPRERGHERRQQQDERDRLDAQMVAQHEQADERDREQRQRAGEALEHAARSRRSRRAAPAPRDRARRARRPRRGARTGALAGERRASARGARGDDARRSRRRPLAGLRQAVGHAREHDALLEQQQPLDEQRALVVQDPLPAVRADDLGHHDHADGIRIGRDRPDLGQQRLPEVAVGRRHDLDRDREGARCPGRSRLRDVVGAQLDVQRRTRSRRRARARSRARAARPR